MGSLRSLKKNIGKDGEVQLVIYNLTRKDLLLVALGSVLNDELAASEIQRYLYVVMRELAVPKEQGYLFESSIYGPSIERAFYDDLKQLEIEGLARSFTLNTRITKYRLTKTGKYLYRDKIKTFSQMVKTWLPKLTDFFHDNGHRDIIVAICSKYPEWKKECIFFPNEK